MSKELQELQELEELDRLEKLQKAAQSKTYSVTPEWQARTMASATLADQPWYKRAAIGAGARVDEMMQGLKGLVPGTERTPEEAMRLKAGEAIRDQSTAANVGSIGTDIAMMAYPATRAAQGLQVGARMLPRALQFVGGSLPTNIAAGAALSGALTPENRGTAAALGGAGAGAGELAGRVLTKSLGGLVSGQVTPEARAMMDEGMFVPMWKATESNRLRDLAERATVLPVAGSIMRGQERAAIESFNRSMAAKATPPKPVLDEAGNVLRWESSPVREAGSTALNTLRSRFDEAYDALYKGRGIPVDDTYTREVSGILQNAQAYFPRIADDIAAAAKQADDILRAGTETKVTQSMILNQAGQPMINRQLGHAATRPESVKQAIDSLEPRIAAAYRRGDVESADALKALKGSIEELRVRGLPPEVAEQAAEINRAYATYKQLERATGAIGAQTQGVTTPRQMLSAIKAGDRSPGKSAFARERALNQAEVLRAERILGSRLPETGPGTAEKLAPLLMFGGPMVLGDLGATTLLGTQTGQRFLQGALPGQAFVRGVGSEYLVPALRSYGMAQANE